MTLPEYKIFSPFLAVFASGFLPASAQDTVSKYEDLKVLLLELKQEQAALSEKIDQVERLLNNADVTAENTIAIAPVQTVAAAPAPQTKKNNNKLKVSGDLQLRYEDNFSDDDMPDRNRAVMRARLRADYALNSRITIGAELSTGDSDDPNSVHVTLSDFVDDFEVSLSRLYAKVDLSGGASLIGGKFANPFTRTDLVWDGDVHPQGVTAIYAFDPAKAVSIKAAAIYSIIDETASGPDSDMLGAQINIALTPSPDWRLSAAASYYDYSLDDLSGADAGDFRSNLRDEANGYLSDFNLFNILASVSYHGFGERWPVTFTGDFIKNYGAAVSADEGYSAHIAFGRTTTPGDWNFAYGYSQAEVDSVLGVFSHDNLSIATNYQSHLLAVDYTLFDQVVLNATLYHYKPLEAIYAGIDDPDDWLDRLRLNMTIGF